MTARSKNAELPEDPPTGSPKDPALRLVSAPSALLHPEAAEALTLAARPLEVVAEVLSDGTLQSVERDHRGFDQRHFSTGTLAGDGWTLWWQRRSWSLETA
jgi:hypothetical protein